MKTFFLLILIVISLKSFGQVSIDFVDTTNFYVTLLNDTINNGVTYPDIVTLDLDCDERRDLIFKCYTTPIPNFPSAHHIIIQNPLREDLEIAQGIYRTGAAINPDTISNWENRNIYGFSYFTVHFGPNWIGRVYEDEIYLEDMNLLYRFNDNDQYRYGWINFSCRAWPATLIIHEIAFDRSFCLSTSTKEIPESFLKLYPNPFSEHLNFQSEQLLLTAISWKVFGIDGRFICQGELEPYANIISLDHKIDKPGTYIIQFFTGDKLTRAQVINKI